MSISEAKRALEKGNFGSCEDILETILRNHPKTLQALITMSVCCTRSSKLDLACEYADQAIELAFEKGNNDTVVSEACVQKGITSFKLKDYEDAFKWFNIALLKDGNGEAKLWKGMCERKLIKAGIPNEEIRNKEKEIKHEWQETAPVPGPSSPALDDNETRVASEKGKITEVTELSKVPASVSVPKPSPVKQNVRFDWFDSIDSITLSIYVKKINPDSLNSKLLENSLSVEFKDSNGFDYNWEINFAHSVNTEKSNYRVFGTKLEYNLQKLNDTITWTFLSSQSSSLPELNDETEKNSNSEPNSKLPSFSKKIDWSKIDEEVENDKDNENPDAFFQTLYQNADADTQRAMLKSYTESNGTSLSMSWDEVGNKYWEPYDEEKERSNQK
ncbi:hypothetical protein DAMA08_053730 [Martiniozyma asiatica (nom. inval.)]|nr:hypothetical protein DAMA08_053730 [Martiniozyma asiatica]